MLSLLTLLRHVGAVDLLRGERADRFHAVTLLTFQCTWWCMGSSDLPFIRFMRLSAVKRLDLQYAKDETLGFLGDRLYERRTKIKTWDGFHMLSGFSPCCFSVALLYSLFRLLVYINLTVMCLEVLTKDSKARLQTTGSWPEKVFDDRERSGSQTVKVSKAPVKRPSEIHRKWS